MFKQVSKKIGGRTYTVKRLLNAADASDLYLGIVQAGGEVLFPIVKAIWTDETTPEAMLAALGSNAKAAGAMLARSAGMLRGNFPELAPLVFKHVHCDRTKIGDSEVPSDLAVHWEDHFTGRAAVVDLWQVAWLVLTANFEMPSAESPSSDSTD